MDIEHPNTLSDAIERTQEREGENSTRLLARRRRAAELRCLGWSQTAIGVELGESDKTIQKDLAWIEEHWRRQAVQDWDLDKRLHLQRLEDLYQLNMKAYRLSCEAKVRKGTRTKTSDKHGDELEQTITVEEQVSGNSNFLRLAHEATVEHLKFTCGYAPVKAIIASEANQAAWKKVIEDELTPEEIRTLERIHSRVKQIQESAERADEANTNGKVIDVKAKPSGNGHGRIDIVD